MLLTDIKFFGAEVVESSGYLFVYTFLSAAFFVALLVVIHMMTSSNGSIFRVTGHLCGEFTGPRWIPHTKARDAELWCFLWSASK